jgi:DNA modification methylase
LSYETGFSESELNKWLNEPDQEDLDTVLDSVSTLTPRAQVGDIYTLGDHRLACGDSTDEKLMADLMQSDQIELIWEDPPYGIAYETPMNCEKTAEEAAIWRQQNSIENDSITEEQLDQLLTRHMSLAKKYWRAGGGIYWCHDIRFTQMFRNVLKANKVHVSDTLIWKKQGASTWLTNYVKYYEPILYGWENSEHHRWYGDKWNPNTIELSTLEDLSKEQLIKMINKIHSNYQEFDSISKTQGWKWHPTVKPPKLISYHILNSTKKGEIVYDGFAGSGSTLIAAEKTARRARCIEFEPKYIDVAITRWQEETGLQAVRQDGTMWDDISQQQVNDNLSEVFDMDRMDLSDILK